MTCRFQRNVLAGLTLAVFAGPVAAQSGICGGVGDNGQWIGGAQASSDIATASDYAEQMALVLAGNEYIAVFDLTTPASVRVEAEGRGAGDPLFDILDNDGTILISDDDSGGNGSARAELDLNPGTYCVALSSYDSGPMTAFVRIGLTSHEPLTAGIDAATQSGTSSTSSGGLGSCADATPIGLIDGPMSVSASVDESAYWSFEIDRAMPVSITAENDDADPTIALFQADETYLAENDDFDGLNSRIDMVEALQPGTYCIGVGALNDTSLPIDITISEYDPEAALAALYAQGEAAPPMDGSVMITDLGQLESRLRQDAQITDIATWYSLDVAQGGLLVIEAISADGNGDPWVAVYDDLGRRVALNDDYGEGLDSFVAARITGGTYLIAVKEVTSGSQGFMRMVFERYVPAP